jgi:F5/8 type C domain-containing protein
MLGFSRSAAMFWLALLFLVANTLGACTVEHTALGDRLTAQMAPPEESPHLVKKDENCANLTIAAGIDKYCVSSVLQWDEHVNRFRYGPNSLFDNDNRTAWVEGVDGQGIGEWIVIEFDQLRLVKAIEINNGYNKDRELYLKNSRVKEIKVEFSRGVKASVVLKDTGNPQPIPLPHDHPLKTSRIKFTIESVYPGTKFEDTAISELHIVSEPAQP